MLFDTTICHSEDTIRPTYVQSCPSLPPGSEFDSDENLDLSDEEDILEKEAGDNDDVGTEEDLRDQVGRVHL